VAGSRPADTANCVSLSIGNPQPSIGGNNHMR
jgi:hypothetical protein